MSHSPPLLHSPEAKRPKGILKNPSYSESTSLHTPGSDGIAPTTTPPNTLAATISPDVPDGSSHLSEKDITIQNTLKNAGRRRSSSMLGRTNSSGSRRQSLQSRTNSASFTSGAPMAGGESPQLKWDEANLYLNEQQKSSTMKITEPKTPYAKTYDPLEDEAEIRRLELEGDEVPVQLLDANKLDVDELDKAQGKDHSGGNGGELIGTKPKGLFGDEIPGLDIGEPEEDLESFGKEKGVERVVGGKQVVLEDDGIHGHGHGHAHHEKRREGDDDDDDDDGDGDDDDDDDEGEEEKHRKFMELRKKHYEMRDIKGLLGHPEDEDDDDEDDDGDVELRDAPQQVPPVPPLPNGKP